MPPPLDPPVHPSEAEGETEPAEASLAEVGQQLAMAQEHLRGLHVAPRDECWRCRSAIVREHPG